MARPGLVGDMRVMAAVAAAALTGSCASVPKQAEVPASCGLPAEEPWTPLASPPSGAIDALEQMRAANPFHAGQAADSQELWLRLRSSDRLAHCEYSVSASCGVGSTVLFDKSGDAWKPADDALITVCSKR